MPVSLPTTSAGGPAAVGAALPMTSPPRSRLARPVARPDRATSGRRDLLGHALSGAMVVGALALGPLLTLRPLLSLAAGVVVALVVLIWLRPEAGGYLVVALTPLMAGIDRGRAVSSLRPHEVLQLLVALTLLLRGIARRKSGVSLLPRLNRVEVSIALLAGASSLTPLLWMVVRRQPVGRDDLLYALVIWKYGALYTVIRACIRTDSQIQRCLRLFLGSACIVAALAVLQSLGLFGVPRILSKYYAPFGYTNAFQARGSSTLGLPAATADYLIFCLAIAIGLMLRAREHRLRLGIVTGLCVCGALSAAEFSSAFGLAVGAVSLVVVTRRPRLLSYILPAAAVGGWLLRPVINRRLSGFHSLSGVPVSWTGRLQNLRNYFWPQLFSHWNFVLGVRPSARVAVSSQATGFVWIESGYTWLLWGGGIPLVAAFIYFIGAVIRAGWDAAGDSEIGRSVAGSAVFVAAVVIVVEMVFDMHLTYRGSADAFFVLVALAVGREPMPVSRSAGSRPGKQGVRSTGWKTSS